MREGEQVGSCRPWYVLGVDNTRYKCDGCGPSGVHARRMVQYAIFSHFTSHSVRCELPLSRGCSCSRRPIKCVVGGAQSWQQLD